LEVLKAPSIATALYEPRGRARGGTSAPA